MEDSKKFDNIREIILNKLHNLDESDREKLSEYLRKKDNRYFDICNDIIEKLKFTDVYFLIAIFEFHQIFMRYWGVDNKDRQIYQRDLNADIFTNIPKKVIKEISKGHCFTCRKSSSNMMKCSKCNIARYCNKECQKIDWGNHKLRCNSLKEIEGLHDLSKINKYTLITIIVNTLKLNNFIHKLKEENVCFINIIDESFFEFCNCQSEFNSNSIEISFHDKTYLKNTFKKDILPKDCFKDDIYVIACKYKKGFSCILVSIDEMEKQINLDIEALIKNYKCDSDKIIIS